jgi:two-component system cell cycle sensor histidine kinase/response regulator CckA
MSEATKGDLDRLVRENEALRRRVAALETEAELFKTTLQSIGDAVISVDTDRDILQMNGVARQLTGWGEAEALGQPLARVFRIINEDTRAEVESPVERVLREGVVVGLANHTLLIAKDGKERPIADSAVPIRKEKGESSGVVLVFRGQVEERAAQETLRQAGLHNRSLIEASLDPLVTLDPEGKITDVNEATIKVTGCPREKLTGAARDSTCNTSPSSSAWGEGTA